MVVKIIEDREIWDKFVDKSPYGMLFHKWELLRIAEKYRGYKLYPYGIYKGTELIAIFPIFVKKYLGRAEVFSPPPGCDIPYMGLVPGPQLHNAKQGRREVYWQDIMKDLEMTLAGLSAWSAYFKFVPEITDIRQFLWKGFHDRARFSYIIDLKRPLEDLWMDMDGRIRKYINKESIALEQSSDVDTLYRIMSDRYRQQKLKYSTCIVNKKYLEDLLNAYPDNLKMYLARRSGKIINVRLDSMYKDLYLEWIGHVNLDKESHSNEFMRWHFIKEAKAQGYSTYEIYGADAMRLCPSKNKYNPSLICSREVYKMSLGIAVAESAFRRGKRLIDRLTA